MERPRSYLKAKIIAAVLLTLFILAHPAKCEESFRRGLFVSVIQEPPVLSCREDIYKLVAFAKKYHIRTLFVQIYYANKAWFPSQIADRAPYDECVKSVSEDPMALLIREARLAGIEVHAWVNMLSLCANKDAPLLKKYGPGILTRNLKGKRSIDDYKIDNQYFLEPGDPRVRQYLLDIVGEILKAYPDLDGIQFDYIRYPDKDPEYGYTKMNMERFKKTTGNATIDECSQTWKDWKSAQVTELLEALIGRTREFRKDIRISATGCMPYSRALFEAYQNWPSWINNGLIDFVTVMSYSPYPDEFERSISNAKGRVVDFKKVNIALGAYRLIRLPGIFRREYEICKGAGAGGYVIFHYGSLLEDPALSECLATH